MPELTVKLGDQVLQTHKFEGDLLCIGRSRENDIVLENLSVSRQHIQIRYHGARYTLTDMNSANGTLLNGVRITKTEIVDEDVITLGKYKLTFSDPSVDTVLLEDELPGKPVAVAGAESRLVVESGRLNGREFKITRFETSLGKAATNDIVLTDDWLLGKKQAIFLRKGNNEYEIQDLGGLRRVKVNGKAISERADVKDGDLVELGGTKMRFHAGAEQPKALRRPRTAKPAEEPLPEISPAAFEAEESPAKASGHTTRNENDSLDLADEPQSATVRVPEVSIEDLARHVEPYANPEIVNQSGIVVPAKSTKRNVFEDRKSNGRKKRRQQRQQEKAAQQESLQQVSAENSVNGNGAAPTSSEIAQAAGANIKEIQIWEEALKSSSPAIRRQAARTLKQLTGIDYEV